MRSRRVIDTEIAQLEVMRASMTKPISNFGMDNRLMLDAQIGALKGRMHLSVLTGDEDVLRVFEHALDWLECKNDDAPSKEWSESPWLFT